MDDPVACVLNNRCASDVGSDGTSFAHRERSDGAVRVLESMEAVTAIVPAAKLITFLF